MDHPIDQKASEGYYVSFMLCGENFIIFFKAKRQKELVSDPSLRMEEVSLIILPFPVQKSLKHHQQQLEKFHSIVGWYGIRVDTFIKKKVELLSLKLAQILLKVAQSHSDSWFIIKSQDP